MCLNRTNKSLLLSYICIFQFYCVSWDEGLLFRFTTKDLRAWLINSDLIFFGPVPHLEVKIAEVLSENRWKHYSSFRQKVPLMFKGKCRLSQTKLAEGQCNEMEIIFEEAYIVCWLDCRYSDDLHSELHMEMLLIFYDVYMTWLAFSYFIILVKMTNHLMTWFYSELLFKVCFSCSSVRTCH